MKKRLQTVLAHAGVASRRHSAEIIEKGLVKVDGKVVRERGFRLDPSEHDVTVQGKSLPKEETKKYILLNKPVGFITTVKDTHGRRKVVDLLPESGERLYPVGRLDKDTTGIILLTNDGDLAHRLSHPRYEIEKEYRVGVKGEISPDSIKMLECGVKIEGKKTSPCTIKVIKEKKDFILLTIRIHEGRKRQIRHMIAAVGGKVISLERRKYAGLSIKGLEEGEWRELTEQETKKLRSLLKDERS